MTVLVSLPLALSLREMIARHLGTSLAADSAAESVNYDWMQEFSDQATGIGVTFKPTIIGFGAVLDNLSAFVDRTGRPAVIVGAAAVYILLWIFLAGGHHRSPVRATARLARSGSSPPVGCFSSGSCAWPWCSCSHTALLFGLLHTWLFDRAMPRLTHDVTVERTAFLIRLAMCGLFGVAVAACTVVFDYSKGARGRRGPAQRDRRALPRPSVSSSGTRERLSDCFS